MKILYIFADQTSSVGVFEKVEAKIRSLNENGVECKGLFFRFDIDERKTDAEKKMTWIPVAKPVIPFYFHRRFLRLIRPVWAKRRMVKALLDAVEKEVAAESFDLILFRYPLASAPLYAFTKTYRKRFVFEHNADEIFLFEEEYRKNKNLNSWYNFRTEKKYGPKCTANALGLISVGFETQEFQLKRSGLSRSACTVIANGINVAKLPVRHAPRLEGDEIRLMFLTGSPRFVDGIDLILKGLRNYPGKEKLVLYVVGPVSELYTNLVSEYKLTEQVVFTGMLRGEALDAIFDKCHIAIATMALHRKGLKEHSALKVLEYVARGIPFVLSYDDTNFIDVPEMQPYMLRLEEGEKELDMKRVVDFARKIVPDEGHVAGLRAVAEKHLDAGIKMKQLQLFLEKLMHGTKG